MNPWEIVAEEDRSVFGSRKRLVLLRRPEPHAPYTVYALDGSLGYWKWVGRFALPETDGTEAPDWALNRAWSYLNERGLDSVRGKLKKTESRATFLSVPNQKPRLTR